MCGIIGIYYKSNPAAPDVYTGLMNLQHRGKETAGIAIFNNGRIKIKKGIGEVAQIFPNRKALLSLPGNIAIGQTKYTTTGGSYEMRNIQPIINTFHGEEYAMGHNGNIVNINTENRGELSGVSDTYLVSEMISRSSKKEFVDGVIDVLHQLKGSFNFIFLFRGDIYIAMDRFGFHPMSIGENSKGYIVSSETCAIDQIGAEHLLDIMPGQLIKINDKRIENIQWTDNTNLKSDIFEFIYFSRPDSYIYGVEVGLSRYYMGRNLASKYPLDGDIVVPVPDSANEAALGYYDKIKESRPFVQFRPWALFRSHYIGRTFIEPIVNDRSLVNRQKFNPRKNQFFGKRVIIIDDSIVRSNTSTSVCQRIKKLGAKEIYFLSASPKYLYPDIYGTDTYRQGEKLIMHEYGGDEKKLAQKIGIDMVGYLNLQETIYSVLFSQAETSPKSILDKNSFYTGPFTGKYPDGSGYYKINI
jgi:amidophosphoribosyltransferase